VACSKPLFAETQIGVKIITVVKWICLLVRMENNITNNKKKIGDLKASACNVYYVTEAICSHFW